MAAIVLVTRDVSGIDSTLLESVRNERRIYSERAYFLGAPRIAKGFRAPRQRLSEEPGVVLDMLRFFGGYSARREDRADRTGRFTCSTVDTLVRIDVELPRSLIDTVHWTLLDTRTVHGVDARAGDDVRHCYFLSLPCSLSLGRSRRSHGRERTPSGS